MYCELCGAKLGDNGKYCPMCGKSVRDGSKPNVSVNQQMEGGRGKLLYQAKYCSKRQLIGINAIIALCIVCCVAFVVVQLAVINPSIFSNSSHKRNSGVFTVAENRRNHYGENVFGELQMSKKMWRWEVGPHPSQ